MGELIGYGLDGGAIVSIELASFGDFLDDRGNIFGG